MAEEEFDANWKLRLRYGKLTTEFQHFAVIADGIAGEVAPSFNCPPGPAVMAMKGWCVDSDDAVKMICAVGAQIGFTVTGKIELYEAEPESPPREKKYGYSVNLVPYE